MANRICGLHLLVDGQVEDTKVFKEKNLNKLIMKLAEKLDMVIVFGPITKTIKLDPSKLTGDVFQDEGGSSVFCMISTSHISIHVWPLRKAFLMDVFSCRNFDRNAAEETIKDSLVPTFLRVQEVIRSSDTEENIYNKITGIPNE
jgi:S-adenosylmethionine decarboxylase